MPGMASSFEEPAKLQLLKRKLEALNYTDDLDPAAAPLTEKARPPSTFWASAFRMRPQNGRSARLWCSLIVRRSEIRTINSLPRDCTPGSVPVVVRECTCRFKRSALMREARGTDRLSGSY